MRVAFIHRERNPVSMECARAIGEANWYRFNPEFLHPLLTPIRAFVKARLVPHHDVYLVEGGLGLAVGALKKSFGDAGKVIMLANDPFFYFEDESPWGKVWKKILMNKIDGVIAVSKMVAKDVERYISVPTKVAYPFVMDEEKFLRLEPNLESKDLVFVGNCPGKTAYFKGVDLLVEAFKILKKNALETKLYMVGMNLPKIFSKMRLKSLFLPGQTDPTEYLSKSAFYVHPARYDAFSITVIEAALAGVIPLVSSTTGAKELVEKVDPGMIFDSLEPKAIAEKILSVRQMGGDELKKLSEKIKRKARRYSKEKCLDDFKKAFKGVACGII